MVRHMDTPHFTTSTREKAFPARTAHVHALYVIILLIVCSAVSMLKAATLYWDADGSTTTATGGTGNWDTSTLLWRTGSSLGVLGTWPTSGGDNDANLSGTSGTLTLTTGVSVNDISVNPSPSGTYTITGSGQTLSLGGSAQSVLDVATGSTLAITPGLAGLNGFTKSSAGTLTLDGAGGTNGIVGGITVSGGTLQAGSATNNGASQVLRSNAVNLAGGTTLTTVGTTVDLRVGSLSGSGSVTPAAGGAINELALTDATFSGAITTTGGLNLRGANGTTQSFSGNLTGLSGTIGINSGATMVLSGTGTTNGVIGGNIAPRGGSFVLDNTGGNTSAASGRAGDAATVQFLGGTFSLLGNATSGTTENVGNITLNSGAATVSVTHNGGVSGTVLNFANSGTFSLRASTSMTVNFVGNGGTLGSAGANPRITFTGTPFTGTGGLLANSAGGTTVGWATVNGSDWAGLSGNSIVAVSPTLTASTNTTLQTSTSTSVTVFNPSANQTLSGAVAAGALKFAPTADNLSLNIGTNSLTTFGVMLAGTNNFSITGSSGTLWGAGAGTRYVHVVDSNTTLSVAVSLAGANQPFNKAGAGVLNLNGASNQLNFTSVQNVNVLQGIMRGTLTSLGGGTSAGGAFTTINLYGGVLEISGGGTFSRTLNVAGAAGGGGIKIDGGGSARGDGGFSAIGGDATVTLVTAVGGATAATPVWNAGGFVSNGYALLMGSTKADSRIDFTNNIGLDDGTAANSYFAREIRVADNTGSTNDVARLSGVITGSANADLLKTGDGVLELTNTNTYAGNTLIQQGTLIATNGAAISNTSAVVLANTAGATLQLNNSETVGALSGGGTTGGNVALQANTLTVGDQRDSTYGGVVSGASGAVVKQGGGTLALTNANTYSGGTTVSAGTLQASNTSGSATGSGTVSVNGSTAVLSGTGTVSGATTVTLGQIKPGTSSSTGTLNFGSNVTLSGSSPGMRMTLRLAASNGKDGNDLANIASHLADGTFTTWVTGQASTYEAMTAGSHDKAVIAGGFNIGAGSQISVDTLGYNPALGDVFNILDWASVTVGGFDFGGTRRAGGLIGDLSLPALDSGLAYDLSLFNTASSSGIVLVVPEPSKAGFVFAGLVALINRRRRIRN